MIRGTCPCCGSTAARTLYECGLHEEPLGSFLRNYYRQEIPEGTYRLDRCTACGVTFQRSLGSDEFLTALYSDWIDDTLADFPYYRADLEHPRQSRDGHELMSLSAFLDQPRMKVLDYGTGWGLWPTVAARLGHEAFAIELAPHKAAWVADHGVTVLSEDELPAHQFHVINLEQTLEHMAEPRALLEKLVPSLTGVLKIAVPNAANVDRVVQDLKAGDCSTIVPVHPFEHVNAFDARSLAHLASSLGLKEVRPSLGQRFAFFPRGVPGSPRRLVKEVIRPFWNFNNRTNLYRWFVRR